MSKQLASVRSNMSYHVDYKTMELVPQVELVILTFKPAYTYNSKSEVTQVKSLDEVRLTLTSSALNALIGEMQQTAIMLQQYEQMGAALNSVVRSLKK